MHVVMYQLVCGLCVSVYSMCKQHRGRAEVSGEGLGRMQSVDGTLVNYLYFLNNCYSIVDGIHKFCMLVHVFVCFMLYYIFAYVLFCESLCMCVCEMLARFVSFVS